MNSDQLLPPRLDQPKSNAGKVGLGLSLLAPGVIALMMLLHPG